MDHPISNVCFNIRIQNIWIRTFGDLCMDFLILRIHGAKQNLTTIEVKGVVGQRQMKDNWRQKQQRVYDSYVYNCIYMKEQKERHSIAPGQHKCILLYVSKWYVTGQLIWASNPIITHICMCIMWETKVRFIFGCSRETGGVTHKNITWKHEIFVLNLFFSR